MPRDGILKPRPDVAGPFSEGSGIALDGEEDPGSWPSAEGSGDLLPDLDHPEVLFGLVVGKGDGGVEGKGEDLAGVFFEATEEILCGSGFDSSSAFSGKRPAGLDPCPGEESLEASEDLLSFRLAGHGGPGGGLLLEIEKEGVDLGSPKMAVELGDGLQLAENMGVAEGVLGGEGERGPPEVVDQGSVDVGSDPQGLDTLQAPFFMEGEESQARSGGDMTPVGMAIDAESGFVDIHRGGGSQKLSGLVLKRGKMECERPAGADDRPFAHDRSEEVGAELPNPAQRDRLVLVEIGDKGEEAGPVLGRRRDSRGSRSDGDLLAGGATDFAETVFRHLEARGREIEHLSGFILDDRHPGEILPAGTARHRNLHLRIGSLHRQEGVAFVPRLSSGLLPRRSPETFGSRLSDAVA